MIEFDGVSTIFKNRKFFFQLLWVTEIAIASDVGNGEYYDDVAPEKIAEVACANDRALIAFPSAVGALIENKNITSSIGHDFCMHDDSKAFRSKEKQVMFETK